VIGIRVFPILAVVLMLGPVAAGLAGTLLPAFGWLPALGGREFGLDPLRALLAQPGIGRSILLSATSGLVATALSLAIAVLFVAAGQGTRPFAMLARLVSPMLSVPHVTLALGLAFLIAPSGWLVRLVSPGLTGWVWPPDLLIVHDPYGLSMIAGLVLKEVPFLFLMILAASEQVEAERYRTAARALGYAPMTAWLKVVLPRVYPRIRLPVLAVLAFSASVVDLAMILGPTVPAPLAVRVVEWANDPDLSRRFLAAAGALVQLGVVVALIGLWWAAERAAARLCRPWLSGGGRGSGEGLVRHAALGLTLALATLSAAALIGLAIWSVARTWRFPDALPDAVSLRTWMQGAWLEPLGVTVVVAALATAIATVVVVGCLEAEIRSGRPSEDSTARVDWLLYLPLLVPQVGFLFGVQVLLVAARLDGGWLAVVWSHLVFVLPYVFLSMAGAWRRFDRRWILVARTLGQSPLSVLFRVTLPMLIRPVLTAAAVGIAVSVALYLPTLFAGAGRLPTLTTEAVALSSGGDRRVIGVYGLLQMLLPLLGFLAAQAIPVMMRRRLRSGRRLSHHPVRGHHRTG